MTIHMLEWDNGELYGDNSVILLGVYSSVENRTAAKEQYAKTLDFRPNSRLPDANFRETDLELDANFHPMRFEAGK